MAKVRFLGSNPIDAKGYASYQLKAQLGDDMTPLKVAQLEHCDGNMMLFNPGEPFRDISCSCEDMRHIRQFMTRTDFEVKLSPVEKLKLSRIQKAEDRKAAGGT